MIHLRARDASAPPGRIRPYFSSLDEVNRAFAALHGQVIAVGADKIAITVHNDNKSQPKSGNDLRVAGAAPRLP